MNPTIQTLTEKKLIGKRMTISLANNKTGELWKSFIPVKKEIQNNIGSELYSVNLYDHSYFSDFNPNSVFEKWATVEVTNFGNVPPGMETLVLQGGLYAVFFYKGRNNDDTIFRYIFAIWLPASGYVLDNRPHFEILGNKYKNGDPDSEEEIWIPVIKVG